MNSRIRTPFFMLVLSRRGERRLLKSEFIFYFCLVRHWHQKRAPAKYAMTSFNSKWKYENFSRQATFRGKRGGTLSFHVVVLQRTVKKCTKTYNALQTEYGLFQNPSWSFLSVRHITPYLPSSAFSPRLLPVKSKRLNTLLMMYSRH